MRALAVVGYKKTGKTTLVVQLAQAIARRGQRVAIAKFTHSGLDQPKTDTATHLEHASAVIGLGPDQAAIFWPEGRKLVELLPFVDADFLLVEGGKELNFLPRVLLPREASEVAELRPELALGTFGPVTVEGLEAFDDPEALAECALARGFMLAGLDCGACGREDCGGLAAEIAAGAASAEDCAARTSNFKVTVNGQTLAVGPFVERILESGIRGMLSELKGYGPGPISIEMEG